MSNIDDLSNKIIYGDRSGIERILKSDVDINGLDSYGYTPLIETAIMDNYDFATLVIKKGADVNKRDILGRSALHWAVESDNLELCQLLIKSGADPNAYSKASQPILVTPLLRNHREIKKLFYGIGADLNFAQDFINTKLMGHRFELKGEIDIVNHKGEFIELDMEGFFLEFTLGIIQHSLYLYKNNFAARHLRSYFNNLHKMVAAFSVATELLKYQQHTINARDHQDKIHQLLNQDLLILPVGYEGHAITFVKYGNILVKCDRGENSRIEGTVVIYQMKKPQLFNSSFLMQLLYQRHDNHFVNQQINQYLGLEKIDELPLSSQRSGNCSWANVEAVVPTMMYLLLLNDNQHGAVDIDSCRRSAIFFYKEWLDWDRDRALYDCVQSFYEASLARKAAKAALLGAVLFQACKYPMPKDLERAEKIITILNIPEYRYILESYLKIFYQQQRTPMGDNLVKFLEYFDVNYYTKTKW